MSTEDTKKNHPPLLVGGAGRSGTTVFAKACGLHPEIMLMPEFRFATDPGGLAHFVHHLENANPHSTDQALRSLQKLVGDLCSNPTLAPIWRRLDKWFGRRVDRRYGNFNVDSLPFDLRGHLDALLTELQGELLPCKYAGLPRWQKKEIAAFAYGSPERALKIIREFYDRVIADALQSSGKAYFLEKNTWNILHFPYIQQFMPEGKMVHVVRDPRDIVASYRVQAWMPDDAVASASILREMFRRWWGYRDAAGEAAMEVRLEDFLSEPEKELRRACDFWGISFDEKMMALDLSRGHVGRWRENFTDKDAKAVTEILEPVLEEYQYELG